VGRVFDAIVLAGAASRRLDGADKAAVEIGGRKLLDLVLDATDGAQQVVVAGPRRDVDRDVVWVQEQPPGGGPVAGIAAALPSITATWCLVLATDLPRIAPAVPLLLTAAEHADVAVLSRAGARNHLAAVWRSDALRSALTELGRVEDAAARELFVGVAVVDVADESGWGEDLDTWPEIEQARHG
jgi:molybdopterin-guanine dinucleotide biosynthesis protein A